MLVQRLVEGNEIQAEVEMGVGLMEKAALLTENGLDADVSREQMTSPVSLPYDLSPSGSFESVSFERSTLKEPQAAGMHLNRFVMQG